MNDLSGAATSYCTCFCHASQLGFNYPACACLCEQNKNYMLKAKNNGDIENIKQRISDLEKWRKGVKILCDQSKKPHKCPTCTSIGRIESDEIYFGRRLKTTCHSCNGKGIVWG